MALSSQILHIIMLFLFLSSLNTTRSTHIEKVSGVDENQQKEALIVEKFRLLLGLSTTTPSRSTDLDQYLPILSPSPSPSVESEPPVSSPSPAPAPALPVHVHSHAHPPQSVHKVQKEDRDKGRERRVLGAVLGSAGATILVCVLGFICICWKFRKHRRKISKTMPSFGNRSMVSGNPGLDLVYLHSLQLDLERQNSTIKASPNQEDGDPEAEKSECDDKEIMSVHNDEDENYHERAVIDSMSSSGDKIIYMDSHLSDDDESFHSCSDSHSCNARLSNASISSLTDKSENFSPKPSKNSPFASPNPTLSPPNDEEKKITRIAPSPPQPPPPPPPPPPSVHFSPLKSTRIVPKASCSSPLPRIISPRNSTSEKRPLASQGSSINIPPPPCPPPFVKGNGNPIKGPPPPPPQQQLTPLGKDGTPLPKLKPLHWDKVRATPDRSMVWDKMRSSSFELDEEMMESLFGYNLHNSAKNDETKSKSPSPGKHILDQKRLQNITILSKALNASAEQICYTLIQGEGLCLQQLEALAKMVPTKEEEMKLCSYKGDINELGSAERFVKAMLSVPFAFLRIESMLYRETFEDEVVHLRKSFSMLEEACKELRSSRLFLKLLEAVLKTGNRMNVGTIRGGARAFKLDTLLKLADVKGTDGKTTLLHFVVQEIIRAEGVRVSDSIMGKISSQAKKTKTVEEREEEYRRMGLELVSGLSTELYNVKKTATIDLDVLASSVSNLSEGMSKLKKLVEKDLCGNQNGGNFEESMREFLNYADVSLKKLREEEGNVLLHVRQITEYFHGELSKADTNPLRIFVIVRDFLGMLDNVCKELRSFKAPPSSPNPLAPFR